MIESCYQGTTRPQLLQLSHANNQVLIINATAINNSIIFVDPVSLNVFNTVLVKLEDFNIDSQVYQTLIQMNPQLVEMTRERVKFSHLFAGHCHFDGSVDMAVFKSHFLYKHFSISRAELDQLCCFLDQKADQLITEDEYLFLLKVSNLVSRQVKGESDCINRIEGMSDSVYALILNIQQTLTREKINLDLLINMYDKNNSNDLNYVEFEKLMKEVSPANSDDHAIRELFDHIDIDGNQNIDLVELKRVFRDLSRLPVDKQQFIFSRGNVMYLFMKAF